MKNETTTIVSSEILETIIDLEIDISGIFYRVQLDELKSFVLSWISESEEIEVESEAVADHLYDSGSWVEAKRRAVVDLGLSNFAAGNSDTDFDCSLIELSPLSPDCF